MRINFTMWNMGRSGGARVVFEVGNRLAAKGHEITYTTLRRASASPWFHHGKCRIICAEDEIPIVKRTPQYLLNYALKRIYPNHLVDGTEALAKATPKCDINIATYFPTAYAVDRSGIGVRVYYIQHFEPLFFEDYYWKRVAEETYLLPLKPITVSTWLRDRLAEIYRSEPALCPNGVDRGAFYPRAKGKDRNEKKILCIGRGSIIKGLNDLLEAMTLLYRQRQDVRLVIVTQRKLSIPATVFPTEIVRAETDDELAELYSQSDLFVSPSWYEGFSLPPLEAMSCGTPVVTTRIGLEDYAADGENALIVEPRQPEQMAAAILRILNNPNLRDKLISNGIETAKMLTWDETANKVEAALFRMASGKW